MCCLMVLAGRLSLVVHRVSQPPHDKESNNDVGCKSLIKCVQFLESWFCFSCRCFYVTERWSGSYYASLIPPDPYIRSTFAVINEILQFGFTTHNPLQPRFRSVAAALHSGYSLSESVPACVFRDL